MPCQSCSPQVGSQMDSADFTPSVLLLSHPHMQTSEPTFGRMDVCCNSNSASCTACVANYICSTKAPEALQILHRKEQGVQLEGRDSVELQHALLA